MRVLLFGATGMVGQGVLRACLEAPDVTLVQTVGRNPTGARQDKLREVVHQDLMDYGPIEEDLRGYDACFFCLGVSSFGMKEEDYARITYDLTLAAARVLARLNPEMTFIYVSGAGTDDSERGPIMWARVKGRTENALRGLPFEAVHLFRPGIIQPVHGARSKTGAYRVFYALARPVLSPLRTLFPGAILTTEAVGLAMLAVARHGADRAVLEGRDIHEAATRPRPAAD